MWSRAWEIQVFCLSLWRTVIASSIPFLSLPDISFPPIYWGAGGGMGAEAKQKHPPLTLLVLSNLVYLLPVLFCFVFLTKLKLYLLQSVFIPVITTQPAPSKCPNLLACSKVTLPFSFPLMTVLFQ